jgi:hypothetical protein
MVAVADRAYASLKLLDRCRSLSNPILFVTRLRLDAALYQPAPPWRQGQIGRPRIKGERLPNLSEVAQDPTTVWKTITIANWYPSSERMVEIASNTAVWYSTGLFAVPLRWAELAIRRTTPALLGLFSLVTLFAHQRMGQAAGALRRRAAWYHKRDPTFTDALALVRKELWAQEQQTFYGSPSATDTVKVPRAFVERLTEAVCYAA